MAGKMAKTDDFVARTTEYAASRHLLTPGQTVLAAVSGGADSVALAAALQLAGAYDLRIAHVHHGLRAEADADADFVAALAGRWGLPVHVERIDTPALAEQWAVGTEEAARRGRYEALAAIASAAGAGAVAVGHHADDQAETVLHRIIRGTHLRGLAGMPARRPLAAGVALVRPLLWARRGRIEEFLRSQGLCWRTDHTNAETDFTRNFIRHDLLPLMRRRLNVRAEEALLRLAEAADEARQTLEELARALFERARGKSSPGELTLRLAPLRKAPPLLAAMALRAALAELEAPEQELGRARFEDLLALLGGELEAVDLPGGIRARRRGRGIRLTRRGGGGDARD